MKGLCLILALFILVCDCWNRDLCRCVGMGGARQHYVEYDFKENVLAPLDEVKVVDGKVVPKKIEYTMMEK